MPIISPINCESFTELESGLLKPLIKDFLKRSGDHEMTLEKTIGCIARQSFYEAVWGIWNTESDLIGYFYMEMLPADYGGFVALISQLYIKPDHFSMRIMDQVDVVANNWAKEKGCHSVAFITRRNPHAFLRRLGIGWALDSYILKRSTWA